MAWAWAWVYLDNDMDMWAYRVDNKDLANVWQEQGHYEWVTYESSSETGAHVTRTEAMDAALTDIIFHRMAA